MSKASTGFAFVAGLTIGAAGAWYYLKDKYAKLAEEEIASVKAAYAKREKPTTEEKTVSVVNAAKHMDKGMLTALMRPVLRWRSRPRAVFPVCSRPLPTL